MPSTFVGSFTSLIYDNIKNLIAPRTWEEYSAAWKDWNDFFIQFDSSPFQSDVNLVLCCISTLMSNNLSASYTVYQKYGRYLLFFYNLMVYIPPSYNHFLIKQTLKGYRKHFPNKDG